jgi:hypothetical protein
MAVMPSQLTIMIEDELGDAMMRLRQQMRNPAATAEEVADLASKRDEAGERLDRFLDLEMEAIDNDPKVKAISTKLSGFTVQIGAAVQEMRDIKSAIEKVTDVVTIADEALAFLAKFG